MKKDHSKSKKQELNGLLRKTLTSGKPPETDRARKRMVLNNLVLHIHPARVPARALKWSFTWGLGGMSAVLFSVLAVTGILLEMNYTPSPPQAYLDILNLKTNVWFGDLIRSLHHWSGNFMVVVTALHLLRVFYTGAHRFPRNMNWIIGIAMLLLVLGANFTGYLLPWDQLAFWAITVGTSLIDYIPFIGPFLSRLLLGGAQVGGSTLLTFYSFHISLIPLALVSLMSFHFWKVRKDGGGITIPKSPGEGELEDVEKVTTIPYLVRREMVFAFCGIALLLLWSSFISAPLEGIANPELSPNPAKAPWYFMGLQELLVHFHPLVGAILIPGLAITALALLPYYDTETESTGVYFRSIRGRFLVIYTIGTALLATPAWVLLNDKLLKWTELLSGWPPILSNGLIPFVWLGGLIMSFDIWNKRFLKVNSEERILAIFTLILTGFVILTLIGIFFRGPGMSLYWPWDMPVHH
jgi:quinol-cytochrome oxidoreductase complex cytochrome b subunit